MFLAWPTLPGLLLARLLTGVALGASVATATAYIADLDAAADGAPSARSGIVATIANVGGLAIGPLLAGILAQYVPGGLSLTFVVLLTALIAAIGIVARSPESREPVQPRPAYRPQRMRAPANARTQFIAATTWSSPRPSRSGSSPPLPRSCATTRLDQARPRRSGGCPFTSTITLRTRRRASRSLQRGIDDEIAIPATVAIRPCP